MLTQLEQLSTSTEGRYATAKELQSLKNFLPTISLRMSAYQKIRDGQDEIINKLYEQMRQQEPNIFQTSMGDVTAVCRRDIKIILQNTSAAMLIDDVERLQENILLWQRTIAKAFKVNHIATMTHTMMPEIMEQFLDPEEYALIKPFLRLNQAILAD